MESHNNTDAFGNGHRSNGDHHIGDSMPGTVGDAQRTLHDKQGQTPAIDERVEVPSERQERQTEERTEANDADVEELVAKI